MAIHFSEKFHQRLMKGFDQHAETDSMFNHDLDMEFSGVYTVHVTSVVTEPLQDYNKNKSIKSENRRTWGKCLIIRNNTTNDLWTINVRSYGQKWFYMA